jgi:MFS transporter, AAHS family, benzoate transport protein
MRQIDLQAVLDRARFNRFHGRLLFWCTLAIVLDGYDLAIVGISLPSIMKDMGVSSTHAGVMVSAALFGMAVGSVLLGTLASHIGRRRAIALCMFGFSLFSALAALATNPVMFAVMRFIAGLGLGGIAPVIAAHMTEYAPRSFRSIAVTLTFSGYSVGGVVAALIGKGLLESYGWQTVFFVAGLPILLVPFMLRAVPESLFNLMKSGRHAEVRKLVAQLDPQYEPRTDDQFILAQGQAIGDARVSGLFRDGRSVSTVLFWVVFFMSLFTVYGLSSWLTKLMASAGYSLGSALSFVLALNIGAVIGAIGGGWLADRISIKAVLMSMNLLAAVSIGLLGYTTSTVMLYLLIGVAGSCTIGAQIVAYAYAGQYYPVNIRSTGIGWAAGLGRSGAIFAPVLIGGLIGMMLPLKHNFIAMAIPAVIAAIAVAFVDRPKTAEPMFVGAPANR